MKVMTLQQEDLIHWDQFILGIEPFTETLVLSITPTNKELPLLNFAFSTEDAIDLSEGIYETLKCVIQDTKKETVQ